MVETGPFKIIPQTMWAWEQLRGVLGRVTWYDVLFALMLLFILGTLATFLNEVGR